MTMTVILITGMPGSGKEEFLKVAEEEGYDLVRMGDVVREKAEMENISEKDISVGEFADKERKEKHEGIWADRTLAKVHEKNTVIDGIRSLTEVNIFKSELEKDARIVAIHSSPDTRFERLKERDRHDAPKTRSQFRERDERELGWGLGDVIARADEMIVNEGSLSQMQDKSKELLKKLN
uniref:Dephospho-CoA kinase n=1 Tax=uncultured organism TaxID=155900 RepID=M1P0Y9_9ZZZZ|nr:dephospho-CoA kinase [uncultured organism]